MCSRRSRIQPPPSIDATQTSIPGQPPPPVFHAAHAISYTSSQSTRHQFTGSPNTGNQLHDWPEHSPPAMHPAQAQTTCYTPSPSTGNQLYRQPEHRQPVIQAAQANSVHSGRAQATSYRASTSTGNPLCSQPEARQPVKGSPGTGNQIYRQPKHRQPVIHLAQPQATSYTPSLITDECQPTAEGDFPPRSEKTRGKARQSLGKACRRRRMAAPGRG